MKLRLTVAAVALAAPGKHSLEISFASARAVIGECKKRFMQGQPAGK